MAKKRTKRRATPAEPQSVAHLFASDAARCDFAAGLRALAERQHKWSLEALAPGCSDLLLAARHQIKADLLFELSDDIEGDADLGQSLRTDPDAPEELPI